MPITVYTPKVVICGHLKRTNKAMKDLYTYLNEAMTDVSIFAIIKPGFDNVASDIISYIKGQGYLITNMLEKQLDYGQAEMLYDVHKDESFFDDLCKYMSSDKCTGLMIANPLHKDFDKTKEEIRSMYGIDEMKNTLHSSDSKERVEYESRIFFA